MQDVARVSVGERVSLRHFPEGIFLFHWAAWAYLDVKVKGRPPCWFQRTSAPKLLGPGAQALGPKTGSGDGEAAGRLTGKELRSSRESPRACHDLGH